MAPIGERGVVVSLLRSTTATKVDGLSGFSFTGDQAYNANGTLIAARESRQRC